MLLAGLAMAAPPPCRAPGAAAAVAARSGTPRGGSAAAAAAEPAGLRGTMVVISKGTSARAMADVTTCVAAHKCIVPVDRHPHLRSSPQLHSEALTILREGAPLGASLSGLNKSFSEASLSGKPVPSVSDAADDAPSDYYDIGIAASRTWHVRLPPRSSRSTSWPSQWTNPRATHRTGQRPARHSGSGSRSPSQFAIRTTSEMQNMLQMFETQVVELTVKPSRGR